MKTTKLNASEIKDAFNLIRANELETRIDHSPHANYSSTLIYGNGNKIADCDSNVLLKGTKECFSEAIVSAVNNTWLKNINPEAVPELLEALKDVYDRLDNMTESGRYAMGLHNIYDSVTSAIEKATI